MEEMKKRHGIILLFLSDYKETSETENEYIDTSESGNDAQGLRQNKYCGRQTNEAPVKSLLARANKDGCVDVQVLCICTNKVRTTSINDNADGNSAYEIFCNRMNAYCKEKGYAPLIFRKPVEYDEKTGFSGCFGNSGRVYQGLAESTSNTDNLTFYIDYTGGMRDTSFLMTTMVRYLEFKGVSCNAIVYSERNSLRIVDITYIYNIMRMINAVNEFVTTGNARSMMDFAETKSLGKAMGLFEKMKEFSESISLCDSDQIEKQLRDISSELDVFEREKFDDDSEEKLYNEMFKLIVPIIREKMYLGRIIDKKQKDVINYPWLIRWCIDNAMIQQALTYYVEKMPVFYEKKNCFKFYREKDEGEIAEQFYRKIDFAFDEHKTDITNEDWLIDVAKRIAKEHKTDGMGAYSLESLLAFIKKEVGEVPDEEQTNAEKVYRRMIGIEKQFTKGSKPEVYSERMVEGDIWKFINTVGSNNKRYIHFLLYNNPAEYRRIEGEEEAGISIYLKKWNKIKLMEKGNIKINEKNILMERERAVRVLKYYLAVKMLRNNMNHAGGNNIDSSEPEVRQYLLDEGIDIEINVEKISRLLGDALVDVLE